MEKRRVVEFDAVASIPEVLLSYEDERYWVTSVKDVE